MKSGTSNPNWRGGRIHNGQYPKVRQPGHPRAVNGYVFEHVLVAERAVGKPLPAGAQVHHVGDRNDPRRIVVCQDQAYHALLHRRTRALEACGNANAIKCDICGQWDDPDALYLRPGGTRGFHRACNARKIRERRSA